MYPFSRDNLFSFNSSTHSYDTRHAFHLPDANLALHLCIFFDVLCGTIFLFLNLGENLIACKHRGFI